MKNKKRFLKIAAVVFAVVFMALSLASCAMGGSAVAGDASGDHGSLKWEYKKDGQTLTVSGSGAMKSFTSNEDIAWGAVATSVKKLVVKDGVTTVGDYAFFGMTALETVELPTGLTSIGKLSFAYTPALTTVIIPDTVKTIGMGAFETSGITAIVLPAELEKIESNTFMYCSKLTSVTGKSVKTVGEKAFAYCGALSTLKLSEGAPTVAENAFLETSFKKEDIKVADNKVKVTYKFVDAADTEKVIRYEGAVKESGESYDYAPPEIEGYELVNKLISVKVGSHDQTVVVTYTKIEMTTDTEKTPADSGDESEAPVTDPKDDKLEPMTIVALVVTVLIIIGIIVGTVLFIRHDKKNTGSRTVRKDKDAKKDKKNKK